MLTIGLAQLKSVLLNKEGNLERAISTIKYCREKQVDYVLFPELFLTGYSIDGYVETMAESLEGEANDLLCKVAKECNVGIIMGFAEKHKHEYYNSAVFIEKNGLISGVYRKAHLFEWEKNSFIPGEEAPIIETAKGKIAMMMTFDAEFPEMARIYALKEAELIMVLSAHFVPYQMHHRIMLRARALENQLFIAVANKIGLEENSIYFGESAFISPRGDFLNKIEHTEKIIIESIDLSLVHKTREQLPMKHLQNRNNKLYKLHY